MTDELQVKPSEVKFLQNLKESDDSAVFKVIVSDRTCILKVYRDIAPAEWHPPFREINPFICESVAYRRLKARGFCERRLIPNFYGVITKMQPALWPSLNKFLNDKLPPNAVLIEYIPDLRQIDLSNFSKQRLAQLLQILHDMHKEKVLHGDAMPRNMMVSEKEDRVLWIDFDRAQTFSENTILARQESWFEEENELVEWFVENLPKDYEEGKLNRCYSYYYDWFV